MNRTVVSVFDVESFRIGGVERFARELSSQLAERGWESVLCFASQPVEAVRRFLDLPNVTIGVLPYVASVGWRSLRDLSRVLRQYRPEIVHFQFTPFVSPYPWLARLHSVKRVFFTDQCSRPAFYVPRRRAFWKRRAARTAALPTTALICVSDYNYRCMIAIDIMPPGRIRRIYNSVDLSQNGRAQQAAPAFREKYSIPPDRRLVLQVSWIIPEKGVLDLLEAARLVVEQAPNVHFVLVGDGEYREQFAQRACEMGLADHVTWTGLVLDPLAEGVYAAADMVCQVSRWQEAFGWTIAEAMSSGKPLVGTQVGGIPELVKDGETGFLVPPGDTAAIAEKILVLLRDRKLQERMGQAGREAAEARFDVKKNVAELIRFYGIG